MRTDSTSKIVLVSLGSVYTYVACVDRGQSSPVLLNGKFCIPTSVQYRDDTIVVGVENRMDPSSAFLFRSMIGQNYFSNKSCYRYLIPSGRITNDKQGFASILCDFMKELDLEIRDAIGPYGKMVVALPEELRNNDMDFKDALRGMEQLNIAFESEPIMIVKAFHSVIPEKHFLVIDIGGTHCSFSVVKGGKKPDVLQSENHPNLSYYALLSSVLDGMGSKENLVIDDPVKLLCYLEEKVKEYIRTGTSFFDLKDCNLNSNTSFSLSDQFFTRYLDDELKELSHVIDHMTGKMDGNEYEILVSGGGASLPFLKAFIPDGQVYEKPEEAVIRGMMVHYGELTQPEVVSSSDDETGRMEVGATIPSHGVSTNDQVLFFGNSVVGEQPGMESRHGVANDSTGGPRATTAGSVSPVPASRPYGASSSLTETAGRQEVLESQSMIISEIDMNLIGEPNSAIQSIYSSTSLPLPPQPECISKYVPPLFVPVVPTIPDLDLPSIPLERSGSSALENFSSLSLDTPQTLEFSNIPEMSVPPSIAESSAPPSSSSSGMDARVYPTVGVFSARSVSAQSEYPCPLPEIMGRIVPVTPALVDGNGNGVSEIPAPPEPPAIPVVPQVPLMERSPPVLPVIPLSKSVSGFVPVIPDVPQSVEAPSRLPQLGLEPVPSVFDAAPDIPSVPDVPPVPDIPDSTIPKPPEASALPIQSGSQPTPIVPSIPQPTPTTPTTPTSPSVPSIPKPPKVPERPTQPMVPTSSSSHRSQLPSPPKPLSSSRYIPAVSSIPERIKLTNRPANRKIRSNFVLMCETNDVLLVKPLEELPVTKEFVYREEKADRSSIDFPIAKYTNGKKKCIGSCYEFIKVKKGTTFTVTIHVDEKGTVLYDMSVDGQQITKLSPLKDITDNDFFSTVCNKHPIIDNSI